MKNLLTGIIAAEISAGCSCKLMQPSACGKINEGITLSESYINSRSKK